MGPSPQCESNRLEGAGLSSEKLLGLPTILQENGGLVVLQDFEVSRQKVADASQAVRARRAYFLVFAARLRAPRSCSLSLFSSDRCTAQPSRRPRSSTSSASQTAGAAGCRSLSAATSRA